MPAHFRDRVILNPGNIPQLPSGVVLYVIGSYRITPPIQNLDPNCGAFTQAIGTALGAVNIYAINLTSSLDSSAGAFTSAKNATSP